MTRHELISAEIHKCYCRAYEKRFGKPYWTNGDYSLLDEPTKDYDREFATWHLTEVKRILEPLVEWKKQDNGYNDPHECITAINETLKIAGISEGVSNELE